MKIIDLLNKIANGEIETFYKFKYRNKIVTMGYLLDNYLFLEILNDEIEFIENDIEEQKKIPEKMPIGLKQTKDGIFNTIVKDDIQYELNEKEEIICKKIHEIIDYLKNKGE